MGARWGKKRSTALTWARRHARFTEEPSPIGVLPSNEKMNPSLRGADCTNLRTWGPYQRHGRSLGLRGLWRPQVQRSRDPELVAPSVIVRDAQRHHLSHRSPESVAVRASLCFGFHSAHNERLVIDSSFLHQRFKKLFFKSPAQNALNPI